MKNSICLVWFGPVFLSLDTILIGPVSSDFQF